MNIKFSDLKGLIIDVESEDKFAPEYKDERLNCHDIDSILFQRTPDDNDRPELEKLFNRLPRDIDGNPITMIFYAFVAVGEKKDEKSNRSVIVNVVDEFGDLVASHLNEFAGIFKDYRGQLVEFEARPDKYRNAEKYRLFIIDDSVRIVETYPIRQSFSPWSLIGYPHKDIKVQECINYYITKGSVYHKEMFYRSQTLLDLISDKMFGIRGMLFPVILDMCLLRDNSINFVDEIDKYLKHINIICTVIIDYIIAFKPKTYLETYKLISYIILNYFGLCLNNPSDTNYTSCLQLTIEAFNVKNEHALYHIYNILKNCGGNANILESIKDINFTINPDDIVKIARRCFANRILKDVPQETIKYLVNLKYID